MKIRDVMHCGAEWCDVSTPLADIAELMAREDIGAVPIGENDRLVGMITDRDIACRAVGRGLDCNQTRAGDILSGELAYCREDQDMSEVLDMMEDRQIRRVPVINEDKRLVGMLSMGDLAHLAPAQQSAEFAAAVSAHH